MGSIHVKKKLWSKISCYCPFKEMSIKNQAYLRMPTVPFESRMGKNPHCDRGDETETIEHLISECILHMFPNHLGSSGRIADKFF
jgi:hypothetical protein